MEQVFEYPNIVSGTYGGAGFSGSDVSFDGRTVTKLNSSADESFIFSPAIALTAGESYTLSFDFCKDSITSHETIDVYMLNSKYTDAEKLRYSMLVTTEWQHYEHTFIPSDGADWSHTKFRIDNNSTGTLHVRDIMLAAGGGSSRVGTIRERGVALDER